MERRTYQRVVDHSRTITLANSGGNVDQYKNYPTIEVETKYGKLTMTYQSEAARMEEYYDNDRRVKKPSGPLAHVEGELVINRIPLKLWFGMRYYTRFYEKGKQLEEARVEFDIETRTAYNKRADGSSWDYEAGYAAKLRDLYNTVLREAYEAHPEHVAEAHRVYLYNLAVDAKRKVDQAREALEAAEKAFAEAKRIAEAA
jgi:hypothetical protein